MHLWPFFDVLWLLIIKKCYLMYFFNICCSVKAIYVSPDVTLCQQNLLLLFVCKGCSRMEKHHSRLQFLMSPFMLISDGRMKTIGFLKQRLSQARWLYSLFVTVCFISF